MELVVGEEFLPGAVFVELFEGFFVEGESRDVAEFEEVHEEAESGLVGDGIDIGVGVLGLVFY